MVNVNLFYTETDLDDNDLEKQGSENSLMAGLLLGPTKLYIVIACLAALLALALLQASCTLYKASKKRTTKVRYLLSITYRFCVALCTQQDKIEMKILHASEEDIKSNFCTLQFLFLPSFLVSYLYPRVLAS